ncbi:hypothetical protein CR513_17971, partial [Mucuna pruriens]
QLSPTYRVAPSPNPAGRDRRLRLAHPIPAPATHLGWISPPLPHMIGAVPRPQHDPNPQLWRRQLHARFFSFLRATRRTVCDDVTRHTNCTRRLPPPSSHAAATISSERSRHHQKPPLINSSPHDRPWMYHRLDANKRWKNEFTKGLHEFLQFVIAQEKFQLQGEKLRCPCNKCKCLVFKFVNEVGYDLYEKGFMPNYYWWTNHGEQLPQFPPMVVEGSYYASGEQREEFNPYE